MNSSNESDILIVGGGVIGLATARELRRRGAGRVTILEKNSACGMESSYAAAGMLAPQAETDKIDDFFDFCRASRDLYPQFAEELFAETGVDIELDRAGTLYLAFTEADAAELEKRYAWQKNANLPIEKLSAGEVLRLEPNVSPRVLCGLRFPQDWQIENRKLLEAFNSQFAGFGGDERRRNAADKIRPSGGGEFRRGEARRLIFENRRIVGVEADLGKIFAPVVIIASGAWTSLIKDEFDLLADLWVKPIRGQMLVFGDPEKSFRHVIYSPRGYAVPRRDCRILVGATVEDAGFDSRATGAGAASLLGAAFEISPAFERLTLKKSWAGLRPFAADGLPILGEFPEVENLFVATAHYRNGILLAPLTARILADRILGGVRSKYLETFSPRRFRLARAG